MQLFRPCAIAFSLLAPFHAVAQPLFTREVFLEQALKVLPVEEHYGYHKALKQGPLHQPGCVARNRVSDPAAVRDRTGPAGDDWTIDVGVVRQLRRAQDLIRQTKSQ